MAWLQNLLFPDLSEVKAGIAELRDLIIRNQEANMANLQEVKDEIAATKQEVADTRGVAKSAVVLIGRLLTMITDAAANATDLEGLKADIAAIHSETTAAKQELAAAVAAGPA